MANTTPHPSRLRLILLNIWPSAPSSTPASWASNLPPTFEECVGHLGSWSPPGPISFGRYGKPMYIAGPYDDTGRVIRTLTSSVGKGNFDLLVLSACPPSFP